MADRNLGRPSGYIAVGTVMDVDDPHQNGAVRVQWHIGAAAQDKLEKTDLPWTKSMQPASDPSLGQVGGPHTGLRVGSRVIGFPYGGDGQDYMIMGTVVAGSNSSSTNLDEQPKADSDIPRSAKEAKKDDVDQPRYGDVNDVAKDDAGSVVTTSIVKYAQDRGGPDKRAADYADLDDSIGPMGKIGGDT